MIKISLPGLQYAVNLRFLNNLKLNYSYNFYDYAISEIILNGFLKVKIAESALGWVELTTFGIYDQRLNH